MLISGTPAAADPGDITTESQTANSQVGNLSLTPQEQRLTNERLARSKGFQAELRQKDAHGKPGPIQLSYNIYQEVSVPTYQQEKGYWCGPATNQQILASPRINRTYSQLTLAGEMGTTTDGTVVGNMRNNLNTHTIYDATVAPNMPSGWIWIASPPGNVTNFVNQHREDLSQNLPSVFNPRGKHPTQSLYLVGWTSDGGHFVAGAGYREDDWALISEVKYVDPYQNPSTNASLGAHWMQAGQLWSLIATNTGYIVY
jgi:hypothetical protein